MSEDSDLARADAEARRLRIMEAADHRLDVVSHPDGEEETNNNNNSKIKLAAMRKRRFQKKKQDTTTTNEPVTTNVETVRTEEDNTAPANDLDEAAAREQAEARRLKILQEAEQRMDRFSVVTTEAPTSETSAKLAAMKRMRFKKKDNANADATATTTTTTTETTNEEEDYTPAPEEQEPKKYLGVAKMRRLKLKDQQQQQTTVESINTTKTHFAPKVHKKKGVFDILPIHMHLVTILLLFLAGLDVGLQQRPDLAMVHVDYAPHQYGLRILQRLEKPKLLETTPPDHYNIDREGPQDEFEETKPYREPNLDPVFGVDLDLMAEGTGLFKMLARLAIAGHRVNLAIFYYTPIRIVKGIIGMLQSLVSTPPILCVVALLVRQVIGKIILGAKLPDTKSLVEGEHKDVMSMAKSFISSFILKAFPTGVSLYDAWVHLRSDMYVVMLGLLIGLAWSHRAVMQGVTDNEVPAVGEPEESIMEQLTERMTDEL